MYCNCPFTVVYECPGSWDCEMIENITIEALAYWDTNSDGTISSVDSISEEDLEVITNNCDLDGDYDVDACEAF